MASKSVLFKTLKPQHAVVLKQPLKIYEKDDNGKTTRIRQVQYCDHLDSIYLDEQIKLDPKAKRTPVIIRKSALLVPEENKTLLEFMEIHTDNEANKGKVFKKVDIQKEEKLEIEKYENLDKARVLIMKSSDAVVKSMAVWFLGTTYLTKTPEKLKITLRHACENSEKMTLKVINFANDKSNDEKLITVIAIEKGVIKIEGGKKVVWADSDEPIFVGAQANDLIKDFSTWLKTDEEGRQNLKLIADKLPKKN